MKKAIYPGSFDPITNGHLDILKRALLVFDEITILVADNVNKKSKFDVKTRKEMIIDALKENKIENVKVDSTSGLSIEYARQIGARHMIRGLRAVSDFEYEFELSATNEYIDNSIDIVFFMAHQELSFISSSAIDELYHFGIDITPLVPQSVIKKYKEIK